MGCIFGAPGLDTLVKLEASSGATRKETLLQKRLAPFSAPHLSHVATAVMVECQVVSVKRTRFGVQFILSELTGDKATDTYFMSTAIQKDGARGCAKLSGVLDAFTAASERGRKPAGFVTKSIMRKLMDIRHLDSTEMNLKDVAAQIGVAIANLDRVGICHRDVKPENIYCGRTEGGDVFYALGDLGLAATYNKNGSRNKTAGAAGSVQYMSSFALRAMHLDGADPDVPPHNGSKESDLFALGASLVQLWCHIYGRADALSVLHPRGEVPAPDDWDGDVLENCLETVSAIGKFLKNPTKTRGVLVKHVPIFKALKGMDAETVAMIKDLYVDVLDDPNVIDLTTD